VRICEKYLGSQKFLIPKFTQDSQRTRLQRADGSEQPRSSPRAEYALQSEKGEKDIDIKFVHIPLKLACEIGLGCSSHGAPFRLPFRSKFKFKY